MAVTEAGAEHQRILVLPHLHGEAACAKMPQFATVNMLLGDLKAAFAGTYHAFSYAKYVHRYRTEFQYRFNRRFDMKSMLPRMLHALLLSARRDEAVRSPLRRSSGVPDRHPG